MLQRVLVTGGAGFIGSHLVRALHAQGVDVTVIDDLSRGRVGNLPDGVPLHPLDVGSAAAADIVAHEEFDTVFHFAARIDLRASSADSALDAQVNLLGTLRLLEAIRGSGGRTRVVFASSGSALYAGTPGRPSCEADPNRQDSAFGCGKLSAEQYLRYFERVHGIESVALRYGDVYGPRQSSVGGTGVVAVFCERLLEHRPLLLYGDGRQTRDFIHVDDVTRANLLAATVPLPPATDVASRALNVGSGAETPLHEVADALRRIAGAEVPLESAPLRPGERDRYALDVSRAEQVLGWRPRVPLEDGLRRTFEWFAVHHEPRAAFAFT